MAGVLAKPDCLAECLEKFPKPITSNAVTTATAPQLATVRYGSRHRNSRNHARHGSHFAAWRNICACW